MTEFLETSEAGIARAAQLLAKGETVAFPTDTVYGLGADARSDAAVSAIYEAKGRPSFNPLIVHVASVEMAFEFGVFSDAARAFVEKHWPAPVTVVVPLREKSALSTIVTAGQPSVALRMPRHEVASQLLDAFGGPLAAPSANLSGRISPTTVAHVTKGLSGRIGAILRGGATEAGLESTILSFLGDAPIVLRDGAFDSTGILRETGNRDVPIVPGQLASHYAPDAALRLNAVAVKGDEFHIGFGAVTGEINLSPASNLAEAAARLYSALHRAEDKGADRIAVAPIPNEGLGRAINDRLRRAAAPRI